MTKYARQRLADGGPPEPRDPDAPPTIDETEVEAEEKERSKADALDLNSVYSDGSDEKRDEDPEIDSAEVSAQ